MDIKIVNSRTHMLSTPVLDYKLCLLCQTGTDEILQDPLKAKKQSSIECYASIEKILKVFNEVSKLPRHLLSVMKMPNVSQCLKDNSAKWHGSCRLKFSKVKAMQLTNCVKEKNDQENETVEPKKGQNKNTLQSSVRHSLRTGQAKNSKLLKCIFCDEVDEESNMRLATTLNIDEKIRKAAIYLNDDQLISKLSAGDMIAIEARYHLNCLTNFYRKHDAAKKRDESQVPEHLTTWFESVALAELFEYIEYTLKQNEKVIMPLAELHTLFTVRMKELGELHASVNKTRLKEKIAAHFPQLEVSKSGRNVLFSKDAVEYKKVVDDCDAEARILMKAAKIVRRQLFEHSSSLDKGEQETSVPQNLLTLVRMILEGSNLHCAHNDLSQAVLTISQLIKFNSIRSANGKSKQHRHNLGQETPLVRYISSRIHTECRSKELIENFFHLGLCVSYKRWLEISTALGKLACDNFHESEIVCPRHISKNEFVTFAVDNIDHNMSSTTSTGSFHGTAISIRTHPNSDMESNSEQANFMNIDLSKRNLKIPQMPVSYTLVETIPDIIRKNLKIPQILTALPCSTAYQEAIQIEHEWLNLVESTMQLELMETEKVQWSSFHANLIRGKAIYPCSTALLPLFQESAHTPSMIYHALNIAIRTTNFLNPDQTPVLACDEPLFALVKELQWTYPDLFENLVPMMGGLHLEMVILRCIGQWLEGSEWETALYAAKIATKGVAQSFLNGTHVTKCRYAHQVTAAVLHILKRRASSNEGLPDTSAAFTEWNSRKIRDQPTFHYWDQVLQLEQCLLVFVRSIREGNFELYISALEEIIPWFFALDHYHYAKWATIHLNDMKALKTKFPKIYSEFMKGKFVVSKTKRIFSSIAIDHSHEQENAKIKGTGGAADLFDNPSALLRWMVAGPEVAHLINSFENEYLPSSETENEFQHHSEHKSNQVLFVKHVRDLLEEFEEYGNPFEAEHSGLDTLITKFQFDENAQVTVRSAFEKGKEQYTEFVTARLEMQSTDLFEAVSCNNFRIFKEKPPAKVSKAAQKYKLLKNDCQLFSRLYIGTTNRSADLDEFFEHENQPFPISLSDNGHLRYGSKFDILTCLENLYQDIEVDEPKDITSYHIEGALIPHFITPSDVKTFGDYSMKSQSYINNFIKKYQRVDVVWDVYRPDSLKNGTREKRGKGRIQDVKSNLYIPKNWTNFLSVNENKEKLFKLLAQDIIKDTFNGCLVVSTFGDEVMCSEEYDTSRISPCNHEESDTRIFIHVLDAVLSGHKKIAIRTVDSDVVVLAVAFVAEIKEIEELWIAFGTKTKFRYIPIHLIVRILGVDMSLALPFFHAITGCDTVSAFFGIGKTNAFRNWNAMGDMLTQAFLKIQFENLRNIEESNHYKTIVKFITMCYDCKYSEETHFSLDATRKYLFVKKNRKLENIPPTSAAFVEHMKRAILQGVFCWGSITKAKMNLPDPTLWGWQVSECGTYEPYWTGKPEIAKVCSAFLRCTCEKKCSPRCTCVKAGISCAAFCTCDGKCYKENVTIKKKKNATKKIKGNANIKNAENVKLKKKKNVTKKIKENANIKKDENVKLEKE